MLLLLQNLAADTPLARAPCSESQIMDARSIGRAGLRKSTDVTPFNKGFVEVRKEGVRDTLQTSSSLGGFH
jgi:hypothetical protein